MTRSLTRRTALRILAGMLGLPFASRLKVGLELRGGWVMRKTDI
jgi:hypothetical protein